MYYILSIIVLNSDGDVTLNACSLYSTKEKAINDIERIIKFERDYEEYDDDDDGKKEMDKITKEIVKNISKAEFYIDKYCYYETGYTDLDCSFYVKITKVKSIDE